MPKTAIAPSCVAIYGFRHGNIVVIEHAYRNGLEVPAGSIEPGETPLAAAIRELREETGLEAEYIHQYGTLRSPNGKVCAIFGGIVRGRIRSSNEGRVRWGMTEELIGDGATFAAQNRTAFRRMSGAR